MKKLAKTGQNGRGGYELKKVQSGFTLLELLIVISIMSLLTLIAVSSYTGVQRQARIDFSADSLISAVKEQQLLARSGKVVGGGVGDSGVGGSGDQWKQQCYAIKFSAAAGASGLWTAKTAYQSVPAAGGTGDVDVCLPVDNDAWQKRDIFDGGIVLKKLDFDSLTVGVNGNEVLAAGDLVLYFKPPFGQVYAGTAEGFKSSNSVKKGVVKMIIGIESSETDNKTVEYNLSTQEIKKVFADSAPTV